MENNNDMESVVRFEDVIKKQRINKPDVDAIIVTIKKLPHEHLVEYVEFLERNCPEKLGQRVGKAVLIKLGVDDRPFIEKYAPNITPRQVDRLERLINAKSDRLLDAYLNILIPNEIINEFVLLRGNKINEEYQGHFHNALDLLKLAVEINQVEDPEDLFDTFVKMENEYYENNNPPVDVNTFYKLVIPMLRRYSVKKGPEAYYELRDLTIKELRKHGVTPDHLSIDILNR
ncbi:MAG: hypothetical protein HOE30_23030, partial [Deltaproteobacteria bacterium]|nr:hypothetical protein [Deltaproteobacteria bacterium]